MYNKLNALIEIFVGLGSQVLSVGDAHVVQA